MEIPKFIAICFILLTFFNIAYSQEAELSDQQDSKLLPERVSKTAKGEIAYHHSDNLTNEIPYFDNRFRIDAELEEITLIFFRVRGSVPVILVQPDGKKIRISDYDSKAVEWHDDRTFDMIKITKPMPGPWQAIGDILPNSKILVISDVKIVVDPLPEIVLSGETLKVVGKLYNGSERIDVTEFQDVVQLDVNFYSTNNSDYDNFGADALKLASFKDDGYDLDEVAGDLVYTGEFNLNFAAGEWQPIFVINLPLVTRELRQRPIHLHKTPITLNVETSELESIPHKLQISIDPAYVDPSSLVFQGKITFPDKQSTPFSIIKDDENDSLRRITKIPYTEPGIHRVNLSAFGNTHSGREFQLVVPEYSFNVIGELNKSLLTTVDENGIEQTITVDEEKKLQLEKERKIAEEIARQKKIEEEKTFTIIMIAAGNGGIILLTLIIFFIKSRKKKIKKEP